MYEETDLVELWTSYFSIRKFLVDTAEDGPFNVSLMSVQDYTSVAYLYLK